MSDEPSFRIVDADRARIAAERLFADVLGMLAAVLPRTAHILHVGATSVPGCLTKGDLDIVVRVPASEFAAAEATLAVRYARNDGSIRSASFAAFEDRAAIPHLGIQLTSIGGDFDMFHLFAEALRASPDLVAAYNELKRRHDGSDMDAYRAAKSTFIARALNREV